MTQRPIIPYEEIGAETLDKMLHIFYAKVAQNPILKPIFPDDFTETTRKQIQFQTQYLGGPNIYTEEHEHPMLKARHMPFKITPARAQAWLECMSEAMDEVGLEGKFREVYYKRLVLTAHHMINAPDEDEEVMEE
ncbi:MAG: globin [Kurthia sp.]|nr:globin [Kurthia sp.]